jgi:aspartate racemase
MAASAKRLEQAGADFIIIACNTAHYFIPEVEKQISIPIISMLKETARALKEKGVKCTAVLATDGTVKSGLYAEALAAEGIKDIYPSDDQQKVMMSVIYDYIKKGITDPAKLPHDEILAIVEDLKNRGADALIMACTELPLAFDLTGIVDNTCVDPTSVLAAAAIREAGAELRPGSKL